jgi:hypothetical protein
MISSSFFILAFCFVSPVFSKTAYDIFKGDQDRCFWGTNPGLWDGYVVQSIVQKNEWDTFTTIDSPFIVSIPFDELSNVPKGHSVALVVSVLPLDSPGAPPPPEEILKGSVVKIDLFDKLAFGKDSPYNRFSGRAFKTPAWSQGGILDIDLDWLREGANRTGTGEVLLSIEGTNGAKITVATHKNRNEHRRPGFLACK